MQLIYNYRHCCCLKRFFVSVINLYFIYSCLKTVPWIRFVCSPFFHFKGLNSLFLTHYSLICLITVFLLESCPSWCKDQIDMRKIKRRKNVLLHVLRDPRMKLRLKETTKVDTFHTFETETTKL